MSDDWYSALRDSIDQMHMSLWSAKANAPTDSDWGIALKYQLKAFRVGAVLVNETAPEPGETREKYLQRVALLLEALPASVGKEDLGAWRDGMRELSRVLGKSWG